MAAKSIPAVTWYTDQQALARGEPGIVFSFIAALATALQARGDPVEPVWLMGASGWAFRIIVEKGLCPSSTSVFDWRSILPESVRNAGWECIAVTRLWDEEAVRAERQAEARAAIVAGIDAGTPAIVWDLKLPEWGVITGYDDEAQVFYGLAGDGQPATMPYAELGEREVKILSVVVPGAPNGRPRAEAVRRALETAVRHAEGGEWGDRPEYQDGLAAFEQWARALTSPIGPTHEQAIYHAAHWAGARCYARDFLRGQCAGCPTLQPAADAYAKVANGLLAVWRQTVSLQHAGQSERALLAEQVREAGCYEREAIAAIKRHLAQA
ncbi:MAG: hypothetical protein ABFD20_10520 [Anaerolineales bacterium]